jgi:hypothetical protein
MKHVRQLLVVVMATTLLLAGCAGIELDSGKKITQLREGMTYPEVIALLGQPSSSQLEQGRYMARWWLHGAWKGFTPYDLEFNAKTRRLVAWKENEAEYQKNRQQMAAAFGMPTNAQGGPGAENPAASGNSGYWTNELSGKKLALIQSGTGYYSEKYIFLCRNGSYRMKSNSGNFGGGLASDAKNGSTGRWQALGSANAGTLILQSNNGSQLRYRLAFEDKKLYLDGTRWSYVDGGC